MRRTGVITSLIAACFTLTARAAEDVSRNAVWYSVRTENGAAIGYAYHDVRPRVDGQDTIDYQEIRISEPTLRTMMRPDAGVHLTKQSWRTTVSENARGETTAIVSLSTVGSDWAKNEATIAGGVATVTHRTPAESHTIRIVLPPGVRFDGGDGLLAAWDRKRPITLDAFDIDALAVERVTIAPLPAAAGDAPGVTQAIRRRSADGLLVGQTHLAIDTAGHIVEVRQPLLGGDLVTRAADRATAMTFEAYRLFPSMMRKSPYRILNAALAGHIRFRFGFRDSAPFAVPQTSEQRVTSDDGFVQIDVCTGCGPGLGSDTAQLDDALRPTLWLQSDNARIRTIALKIAGTASDPAAKMTRLAAETHQRLRRTNFSGHASALEALENGSGDCTEEAALLAAFGRAAGVPTRVVNGLVYSRERYHGVSNTFMPHSWVIAYTGSHWQSFDSALGDFDSTHIALTIGDGDERSLAAAGLHAGLLEWQSMVEVKVRPAP